MPNFKINNIVIKNPDSFKKERFKVTNQERLANAKMVGDLIAKKRKYYFVYEAISGYELDTILEAIWDSDEIFFPLQYVENGVEKTADVYVGAIPADLHRAGKTTNWVWKNVNFNLIQQ